MREDWLRHLLQATDMSDGTIEMVVNLLQDMRQDQRETADRLDRMTQAMETRTRQVEEISRKLDAHADESNRRQAQILGAFPSSDIDGHRRYHESVIEWRERRNKLVAEALTKAAAAGFWAGFVWVAVAVWKAVVISVKQG